jgi:hypothetical protein
MSTVGYCRGPQAARVPRRRAVLDRKGQGARRSLLQGERLRYGWPLPIAVTDCPYRWLLPMAVADSCYKAVTDSRWTAFEPRASIAGYSQGTQRYSQLLTGTRAQELRARGSKLPEKLRARRKNQFGEYPMSPL